MIKSNPKIKNKILYILFITLILIGLILINFIFTQRNKTIYHDTISRVIEFENRSSEKIENIDYLDVNEINEYKNKLKNADYLVNNLDRGQIYARVLVFAILLIIILGSLYIFYLIRINEEAIYISQVDKYINSILDQKFDYKLDEMDDSIYSKLNARFNKMAATIHKNFDRMHTVNIETKNYLADISHQIKTPLTSLQINNEILTQLDVIGSDEKSFLEINEGQIQRLIWLTDSMLKLSKLDNNTIKFSKQWVDLSDLIDQFEEILDPIIKDKNLNLKGYGLDTKFYVDPNWTKEAILNIVKNACEHCYENTIIKINAEDNVSYKSITISNKGPNIKVEDINKIFERFYKTSDSKKNNSVGIGLNLSKKIIEMQGGTISVYNEEDGVNFTILFLKD